MQILFADDLSFLGLAGILKPVYNEGRPDPSLICGECIKNIT